MATRKRARYVDGDVEDEIVTLASDAYAPKQIEGLLRNDPAFDARVPHLRTIQRIVKDAREPDTSAEWQLEMAPDAAPAVVIDVLTELVIQTDGRVSSLTVAEAKWVTALRNLAPDIPALETFRLARLYMSRRRANRPTSNDLDAFLAFAPWRNAEQALAHQSSVDAGKIGSPPPFLGQLVPAGWLDHQTLNALPDRPTPPELTKQVAQVLAERRKQRASETGMQRTSGDGGRPE